ncbi:NAD+ synthase [Desulfovibrio sulfodismutans]|uniref:Glutamine-dependent NAD(+) synthetase n=1 Tax=Desulfolutivibrio sulfodismutans TaxID=63561 RepID=A0A7K3NPQ7_9BACT|nr:NAD+ synthase [Desulfolutivibrio sulfodismutans]NDY58151.1 NAD+ synthase [Desulfolutivibrio sulfodismutans]QLA14639.1 NAD+ synthase [Desulfolutivibrio sulfodismutans DSM 3696]
MSGLRLALCQLNPTVGDIAGNVGRMAAFLDAARVAGAALAIFPEMCVTGYPPEDLLLSPRFMDAARGGVERFVRASRGMTVIFGAPLCAGEARNAAIVAHDGRLTATYFKQLLPNYGVFDEMRYFTPGTRDLIVSLPLFQTGVSICEDIWYPDGPASREAAAGATLLVNISASPYHRDKGAARERMLSVRASDCRSFVAYGNLCGGQDELVFDGQSLVFAPDGELLARGAAFAEDLIVADLDPVQATRVRLTDPRGRVRPQAARAGGERGPEGTEVVDLGATLSEPCLNLDMDSSANHATTVAVAVAVPPPRRIPALPLSPCAEVYAALVTGLRDYVRKSGFSGVLIGLSGGIDSSLTAALAADALSPAQVMGVAMPTRYSSDHSLEDARALAENLGLDFRIIPVDGIFQSFLDALAGPFAGRAPDVTEENLQSRARGTLLMALSNKFGRLVVTTGNKSETAVGYSTLYGDTAGGFAVIKDVPKTLVYALARWRNALPGEGGEGGESRAALGFLGPCGRAAIPPRVLVKPPSAELAPGQVDADSLPPYEVLDAIVADYVERGISLPEMIARGGQPDACARVVGLVEKSEYKRRQSPPGVKITPRAFGKDWRLPLAGRFTGGFQG